jgi:hypothetical protein
MSSGDTRQKSTPEVKAETPEQKKDAKNAAEEAQKEALRYVQKAEDAKEAIRKFYKIDTKALLKQSKDAGAKSTSDIITDRLPPVLRDHYSALDTVTRELTGLQGDIKTQKELLSKSAVDLNTTLSAIVEYQNPKGDPLAGLTNETFNSERGAFAPVSPKSAPSAKESKPSTEKVKAEPMTPERMRELALTALDKFSRVEAQALTKDERKALIDMAKANNGVLKGIVEGKPVTFVLSADGRFGRIAISKLIRPNQSVGSQTREDFNTAPRPLTEGDTKGIDQTKFPLLPEEQLAQNRENNLQALARDINNLRSLPNGSSVVLDQHSESRLNRKTGLSEELNVSTVIEKSLKDGSLQVHESEQVVQISPDGKRQAKGEPREVNLRPYNEKEITKLMNDKDSSPIAIEATKERQAELTTREFKSQAAILAGQLILGAGTPEFNKVLDNLSAFLKSNSRGLPLGEKLSYKWDEFGGVEIAYNVQKNELEISRGKPSTTPDVRPNGKQEYAYHQVININNPEKKA